MVVSADHLALVAYLRDDETGAVTIDWVALTAGILLLGIVVVHSVFNNGVSSLVSKINSALTSQGVIESGARTGNASDRACLRSGNNVVCMGPL